MNLILAIPVEYRVIACFLLGACVASLLNLGIYRLAWNQRDISPWSPAPKGAARRTWKDRIPILGWFNMRRESPVHGDGFWIRPMLIEVFFGAIVAALYWWEVQLEGLLPAVARPIAAGATPMVHAVTQSYLHQPLVSHWILLALMTVATFIDIDEKTIPDGITLPGTIVGLLLAALLPWSLPPGQLFLPIDEQVGTRLVEFVHIGSPYGWRQWLNQSTGLWIGWACYWLWCFALLPRAWYGRYGIVRATTYFFAKIMRERFSYVVAAVAVIGTPLIALVWWWGPAHWPGLLTALVGMASGAVMIWTIRVIGKAALQKEAMGFGDVTLMAMIGAFVGWQASLVVFFLAPMAGLVLGVLQWLLRRENAIPYGPFLCVATLLVLWRWAPVWEAACQRVFLLGSLIPVILVFCLILMAMLLLGLRLVTGIFRRG